MFGEKSKHYARDKGETRGRQKKASVESSRRPINQPKMLLEDELHSVHGFSEKNKMIKTGCLLSVFYIFIIMLVSFRGK